MRTALILTGGTGTRMSPVTRILNKGLIPVDGRPVLISIIEQLDRLEMEEIIVFAGHLSWQIEFMLEDVSKKTTARIQISSTPANYSPAQRLLHESEYWKNSSEAVLIYCDNLFYENDVEEMICNSNRNSRVFVQQRSPGNVCVDKWNKVNYSVERHENLNYVELGYWCLPPKVFLSELTRHQDLSLALRTLAKNNIIEAKVIEKYVSISNLKRYATERSRTRNTIFIDRDGVIVASIGKGEYLKNNAQIEFLEDNIKSFCELSKVYGIDFIVVTNQAGIERGLVSSNEVDILNQYIAVNLLKRGLPVIAFYVCPHHWERNCECRKPKPGMLNSAIDEFELDRSRCLLIGDRQSDYEAGLNAGVQPLLLTEEMSKSERKAIFAQINLFFRNLK